MKRWRWPDKYGRRRQRQRHVEKPAIVKMTCGRCGRENVTGLVRWDWVARPYRHKDPAGEWCDGHLFTDNPRHGSKHEITEWPDEQAPVET